MRSLLSTSFVLLSLVAAKPSLAALKVGDPAPDFTTQASLGGERFDFSLAEALKSGPVVLYFFPAAFTPGCTVEAHDFAEAIDQYKALHTTVIGISTDPIETLQKFSVSECRSKFAVAADPKVTITKSYDAVMFSFSGMSNRTSYVITPDHKIIAVHSDFSPDHHVEQTLSAVKAWTQSTH